MLLRTLPVAALLMTAASASGLQAQAAPATLTVTSAAFRNGDAIPIELDHSGLLFRVGRYLVQRSGPDDKRVTVEPDIEVLLSSTDYFSGIDPVWETILDRR